MYRPQLRVFLVALIASAFILFRPIFLIAQSTITTPATASYKLNSGPWPVETFASVVQAATLVGPLIFRHPLTQKVHYIFFYYRYADRVTTPFQILDLNMDTGTYTLVDAGLGRPYIDKTVIHPDSGKLYIPTQEPALIVMYDPSTVTAKTLKSIADNSMAWFLQIGDDKKVYLGESVKGYLERYDPMLDPNSNGAAAAWTNFGIIADPKSTSYYRYVYRLGSDGRYAYMAIRDQDRSPAIWSAVVRDLVTGAEQKYFENDPTILSISAYSSRRGYGVIAVERDGPNGYERPFYRFDGFQQGPVVDPNNLPGPITAVVPEVEFDPAGYVSDETQNSPDSSNAGTAIIRWKKPGDTNWRQLSVPGIHIGDVTVRGVYSYTGASSLLGLPEAYETSFSFNPVSRQAVGIGISGISPYNAMYSNTYHKWYVVGYPSAWFEYDPSKSWTLKPGLNVNDLTLNPHWLPQNPGNLVSRAKYYYQVAEDKFGFIYLGGHHERESLGGSLNWYNPQTKVGGALRTPFEQYSLKDVISALDGTKIIYSSDTCAECGGSGDAKLFVFDAASKTIERELKPWVGSPTTGTIVEAEPGIIVGGKSNTLYKVNIVTGQTLSTVSLPNSLFGSVLTNQRNFVRGPDGYLWAYLGESDIYRIHPISLSYEKILSNVAPAGILTFDGTDLYISGGGQTYFRRISGMFSPLAARAPKAPRNLRLSN